MLGKETQTRLLADFTKLDQRVLACFLALTLQETWRLEVEAEAPIFVLAHWLPEIRLGTAGGRC